VVSVFSFTYIGKYQTNQYNTSQSFSLPFWVLDELCTNFGWLHCLWNFVEASSMNKPGLAGGTLPRTVGIHTSCEQVAFLNMYWVQQRVCTKSSICRSKLLIVTSTTSEQYSVVIKQLLCITHERVSKCVVLCQYSLQNTKASSKCYNYTITIIQCFFHKGDICAIERCILYCFQIHLTSSRWTEQCKVQASTIVKCDY
jgi:hypothetical protein